jgi:hypothetical protein
LVSTQYASIQVRLDATLQELPPVLDDQLLGTVLPVAIAVLIARPAAVERDNWPHAAEDALGVPHGDKGTL